MKKLMARVLKRQVAVQLTDTAVAAIHAAANRAAPNETGGLLLGWWEPTDVHVDIAVEVIDQEATGNSWTRRQVEAQRVLDAELAKSGNHVLGYVGDWHSHPAPVGASRRDMKSLAQSSLQYENPVVLIVRLSDATISIYAAQRGKHLRLNTTASLAGSADSTFVDRWQADFP
ncbi:Mov34/MPN/PAD-1 family protein [Mycobacterium sp. Root135]|uniref:Mov34/MPN/PAD-1 family protein n=1 Tax=Mycobacterium sp. Root135 TaxID=1736457 RepID=UPI001F45DABC|nr:Mov34/MPN/PAD-1 family protein [Mycobacterium sp. Root135]